MSSPEQTPARWREAFRACKDEAAVLTADLSSKAFNRPPEPGAWSVGQCLDHLNEAGRLLVPRLEAALAEAPRRGRQAKRPRLGLLDRLFAWANGPDAWLKLPAPSAYCPKGSTLNTECTVRAFQALQDDLAACTDAAEGHDWSSVKVVSPASRFLRLSAGGWLAGTLAHQRRHLQQARAAHVAEEQQ